MLGRIDICFLAEDFSDGLPRVAGDPTKLPDALAIGAGRGVNETVMPHPDHPFHLCLHLATTGQEPLEVQVWVGHFCINMIIY